jgi:uncharacterized protein (TIGR03118 family)
VFDGSFQPVTTAGGFVDNSLPEHFAPFGIQAIGERIYVTFAMQDAMAHDEVDGPGLGFVNVYDTDGRKLARVASRGALNAPWGIARAPHNFGPHSGELIIGNFGNGRINAFRRHDGDHDHDGRFEFAGALRERGHPIVIDGVWGIAFGNGLDDQPQNTLFFAAGPGHESGGLYGRIDPASHH